MVALSDRLEYVLGAKAAGQLEEYFGIRTVNDLVRHYPRKYNTGSTVLGEDDEPPEEGEHITFVDTITKAEPRWTNRTAEARVPRHHPRTPPSQGDRDVLQREVSQEGTGRGRPRDAVRRGRILQGHNAIDPSGVSRYWTRGKGSRSLAKIAETSRDSSGELLLEGFERDFFPIYPASSKLQSWDIYACVRQVLDVLDPVADPLPESVLRARNLMSEDEALRAIHLSENEAERDRARERLAFDEAAGLQWALVSRRHGELGESGPPAAASGTTDCSRR